MIRYFSILILILFSFYLFSQPQLIDINPGGQSSYPQYFTEFNGEVFLGPTILSQTRMSCTRQTELSGERYLLKMWLLDLVIRIKGFLLSMAF